MLYCFDEENDYDKLNNQVVNIVIPHTTNAISIPKMAFSQCTNLRAISISDSVTVIEDEVFAECTGLSIVTGMTGLTQTGTYVFYECTNLKSITIPNTLTEINGGLFCYCEGLTSVVLPSAVTNVKFFSFAYCTNLSSVVILGSNVIISTDAFVFCSNISSVTYSATDNLTYEYLNGKLTVLTQVIQDSPAWYTANLNQLILEVEFASNTTRVGAYSFMDSNLTSITIPSSVVDIGANILKDCRLLEEVYIYATSSITKINIASEGWCYTIPNHDLVIHIPSSLSSPADQEAAFGRYWNYWGATQTAILRVSADL